MRSLHIAIAIALAAALGACGGLTNAPFIHDGAVVGSFGTKVDPASAWVVARPDGGGQAVQANVDASGRFVIQGLPPGGVTLLASTGLGQAASQSMTVFGDQANRVALQVEPGATLTGIVTLEGQTDSAQTVVGIQGLPVTTTTGADGRFRLTGLPGGCYQIYAKHTDDHESTTGTCLDAGGDDDVALHLRSATTSGSIAFCAACTSDADCGTGGRCVVHLAGGMSEQVCTRECESDADCPTGYACDDVSDLALRLCIPKAGSCAAVRHLEAGTSCTTDADCSLPGLNGDGLCVNHTCTLPCTDDSQCPDGTSCSGVSDTGVEVCQ